MSLKFILLTMLLPLTVHGQLDPDWTGTDCTREVFTIVATSPDNMFGRLVVTDATGDAGQTGDAVTGCPNAPALEYTGMCDGWGVGSAQCVSTLLVDLTLAAHDSIEYEYEHGYLTPNPDFVADPNVCPANAESVTDDPKVFTKLVMWQQAWINTDMDEQNGDMNTLKMYEVKCTFREVFHGELTLPGEILVNALETIPGHEVNIPDPVLSMSVDKHNPMLGEETTLTISFTDDSNHWKYLLVTDCSASNDGFVTADLPILIDSCPIAVDGKNLFTAYDYPQTFEPDHNGYMESVHKSMELTFKAFRIGIVQQLQIRCTLRICPSTTQAYWCPRPVDVDLITDLFNPVCTPTTPWPALRYQQVMGHRTSTSPESFTSTLSTVIVIESDRVIVDSEGQVAPGYTCLTTGTFTAVIAILSVLCLISVAVTVTVCIQGRGRSAPGKSSAMDLPPVGYNNYSVSKHSLA